jgi:hypothetical protein
MYVIEPAEAPPILVWASSEMVHASNLVDLEPPAEPGASPGASAEPDASATPAASAAP